MDELTNIIHGALCMYCEYIGTSQCTDSIEIVCRSLMTAKILNMELNLSDTDLIILTYMRYNTNINQVYISIIDEMILSRIILYSRSSATPIVYALKEMDTDYSINMLDRQSDEIDKIKAVSAKNNIRVSESNNPYERRTI